MTSPKQAKGAVLVGVLVLILVISLLTLFAMRDAVRYARNTDTLLFEKIADDAAFATLQRAILDVSMTERNEDTVFSWESGASSTVDIRPYGPLALATIRASYQGVSRTWRASIGSRMSTWRESALIARDEQLPLTLAGNTQVIGDIVCGALGVASGRLEGRSPGSRSHTGDTIIQSGIDLSDPDDDALVRYQRWIDHLRAVPTASHYGSLRLGPSDSLRLSNHTAVFIEEHLILDGCQLIADARSSIIVAGQSIELRAGSELAQGSELIAPYIVVRSGAIISNVLLFAADSLIIDAQDVSGVFASTGVLRFEEQSSMLWPSIVTANLSRHDSIAAELGVHVRSGARLSGSIVVGGVDSTTLSPVLRIDSLAEVSGVIISEGSCELRGSVIGIVEVERLWLTRGPSTYVNWLADATIDRHSLKRMPALPLMDAGNQRRSVESIDNDADIRRGAVHRIFEIESQ